MVNCPVFCEFGKDVLQRETAEIGMHLHSWNSPPLAPLTKNDFQQQPYLIEYPESAMRDKVEILTDQLQETFNCKMVSHRAGRWAFNQQYAEILIEQGYKIDCSVTPHIHWKRFDGQNLSAECDYRQHSTKAYEIESKQNLSQPALLELPMTVRVTQKSFANRLVGNSIKQIPGKLPSRIAQRISPDIEWFRPNGRNLKSMLQMLNQAMTEGWQYIMLMLHSSELMPGGSPRFSNQQKTEQLYSHLEQLFSAASNQFRGLTLAEYLSVCQPQNANHQLLQIVPIHR